MSLPTDPTWETAAWTAVKFCELGPDEGHEEGQNERGPFAVKPYFIQWSDRNQFYRDIRGVSQLIGGLKGIWSVGIPLRYPDAPQDNIYATGIRCKGVGQFTGSNPIAYTYAIVTVTFTPLTWDAAGTDDPLFLNSVTQNAAENQALQFATQEIDIGYESYPVPKMALRFNSDDAPVQGNRTLKMNVMTMTITYERLPYLPIGFIKSLIGTVNNVEFLDCAVGTIFFDGAKNSRQMSADGNIIQKLSLVFKYRPIPWNRMLRDDSLVWEIVQDRNNNTLYQGSDFTQLLFFQ